MDGQILVNAKRDIPLYFDEFKSFWDATTVNYDDSTLTDCYAVTLIFKNWRLALNHIGIHRLDGILLELHEDINASFFHAYFGHYRSAHMHLRSVIELSLQLLYFYQHEVEYELWKRAEFRIKHEELTTYLKRHPSLNSSGVDNLIIDITGAWKKFSKHIHAEAPTYFQSNLDSNSTKTICVADFNIWKSNFLKTGYQVNKLMLIFFKERIQTFPSLERDILLRNMKSADLESLGIAV